MMRSLPWKIFCYIHLNIWRQDETLAPSLTNVPALGLSEYKPGGRGHRALQLNTKHTTDGRRETLVLESSNDPPNRIILLTDRYHLL